MKKDLVKIEEAKIEQALPQQNEFMMENLDFSDLMEIRGGDKKPDRPVGCTGILTGNCKAE